MYEAIAKFRQDLQDGKKCIGIGITLADPLVSEALADSVAFLWIDLEHSTMSPEILTGHLLAARSKKIPAIVRVSEGCTHLIKSALDAGADGIIIPQVRSVDEVRNLVEDGRYPPFGRRGFGPRIPSNFGRWGGEAYIEESNKNVFLAAMIETREAFEAIEQIVSVPGLDSIVIGPADLTLALGEKRNLRSPVVDAAIKQITGTALAAGKYVGSGMGVDVNFALDLAAYGVQWFQVGLDFEHLIQNFDATRTSFNERWKKIG